MVYSEMINLDNLKSKINEIFGGGALSGAPKKRKLEFNLIADLLPYRSYDEQKRIFINDNSVGFVLDATPLIGADEDVVKTISGIFSDAIPLGCTVQFINFASPKIGTILDEWKKPRVEQGGIYKKLAEKRIEFLKNANEKSLFFSSPFTLKNFRLVISVSLPLKQRQQDHLAKIIKIVSGGQEQEAFSSAITDLVSFRQKFQKSLETIGISSYEMQPHHLISFLDSIINFDFNLHPKKINHDALQPIKKQVVELNNSLEVKKDELIFFSDSEDKKFHSRCFSVKNFPSHFAQWQCRDLIGDFFQDLRRMESPFLTSFAITLPQNEEALKNKAEHKSFNATRLSSSEIARFVPEMKDSAKEWQFVNQKIKAGERLLKVVYQTAIFAKENKINEAEQAIKSIYKTCGFDLVRDSHIVLPSFLALLPFTQSEGLFDDLERLGRTKTMVSWSVANLAPLQGEWSGMNSPCMMLYGRRGEPLFWNPFKNTEGNYNTAVIGKSGSGKSVFMQDLVTSFRGFGGKVFVIDDGRSFMNSARLQGGEFIEFSDKSDICLNPFSIVDEEAMKAKPEYKGEVISLIKSMVKQMCEGQAGTEKITMIQDRFIEEAVQKTWDVKGSSASISDVQNYFKEHSDPRAHDLAILIQPFAKDVKDGSAGIYNRFFEGKSNIKLNNPFMVFELAELKNKKDFQAIVLMFLMFLVSENMYFGDRKTPITLLIDEAWDLLHGEGSKAFIEGLARRARKYCGNIITGTQSVNDYYKTSATIAAFENTDWIILLAQKKESISQLEKSGRIVMDEALKQALNSLRMVDHQYSECIIYGPRGWVVGRLILDPYSIALYSSKAADWARINDLRDADYSLEDALEKIADEKSKNQKPKFFSHEDYRKILALTKEEEHFPYSFENAFEEVVFQKLNQNFPQISQEIYNL